MSMSVVTVYRDVEVGVRARLDAALRAHTRELDAVDPALARIYARRIGRIAGGIAGVVLGCMLPIKAALMSAENSHFEGGVLTFGLIGAVCVSLATTLFARAWAKQHAYDLLSAIQLSGNVHTDIARLESEHPVAALAARADALERSSIAWPLAGIALLAPLSIHLVVAGLFVGGRFDFWMALSYLIVGHAHAFLAICGVRLAVRLRRSEDLIRFDERGWKVYGLTIAVAAIPGVVLLALPPLITAVTGLFIPSLWGWAVRTVASERRVLSV
jgi:hypothetical protein